MGYHRWSSSTHYSKYRVEAQLLPGKQRAQGSAYRSTVQSRLPLPLLLLFGACLVLFTAQAWSTEIGSVPVQVLLVWVILAWLLAFRGRTLRDALSIFSPWQRMALVILLGSAFIRGALDGWSLLRATQMLTGIVLALLAVVFFGDARGRKMLFLALTFGAATSSVVAVLQWFDWMPALWQNSVYSEVARFTHGATGLEATPVSFAYSVVPVGVVLMAGWMLARNRLPRLLPFSPAIAFLLSMIVFAGLVASRSRSGLLGLAFGVAVLVVGAGYLKLKSIPLPILIVLGGALLAYIFSARETPLGEDFRLFSNWRIYAPAMLDFPLGRPEFMTWEEVLYQAYYDSTYNPVIGQVYTMGGVAPPHNFLLATGMAYGAMAALALFFLYASTFVGGVKSLRRFAERGDVVSATWVLILMSAILAVVVHSWFHNAGIALGEMRNWLWLGLLLWQVHQSTRRKASPNSHLKRVSS
jgi:hypothetical protein